MLRHKITMSWWSPSDERSAAHPRKQTVLVPKEWVATKERRFETYKVLAETVMSAPYDLRLDDEANQFEGEILGSDEDGYDDHTVQLDFTEYYRAVQCLSWQQMPDGSWVSL